MSAKSLTCVLLLALAGGGLAGCSRISEPWDPTGYFKQDRERSPALTKALRQRALLQDDRTHS